MPLVVGCLPYATLGGWLGYVMSLKFIRRRRERLRQRAIKRAQREAERRVKTAARLHP